MLFVTRWFGVTGSDAERHPDQEQSYVEEIVHTVLVMQANAASKQHRPLGRGTHAKGICARASFEVFDVTFGRDSALAERLAKGIFAKPGVYPAIVRFGNSDSKLNSDFKPDVRSLSFSVDLTRDGTAIPESGVDRQDFSLQNAPPLPINDARAFAATMKVMTASNPLGGLWKLSFSDKLRVLRTIVLAQMQSHQKIRPYQQLRYWSNVPYRHGPSEIVMQSAIPADDNPAGALQHGNPNGLKDEIRRHLDEDQKMTTFDFALQLLDPEKMTYWGKYYDANFWIENASVKWNEAEAPFHTVARLTLIAKSHLDPNTSEATYFDVTGHALPDSTPVGSINRARWHGEVASRRARMSAGK